MLSPAVQPISADPHTAATYSEGVSASERARPKPYAIAILFGLVALAILAFGVRNPRAMFYDEGYFVPESKVFIQGPATLNPAQEKPPLGKLILAMGMKAAGDNSLGWRASAVVCGALTVVAVFLWSYLLLEDLQLASLAAGLALFNNFLFVMSRIGMLDAFLMIFLIWSLVAFTASFVLDVTVGLRRLLFCTSGILVGLAGACKWNAIDTLAVMVLVTFGLFYAALRPIAGADPALSACAKKVKEIGFPHLILGLIVAPITSYTLTFWPLCRAIHRPFSVAELVAMHRSIWHFHTANQWNRAITLVWYKWPLNLSPQRGLSYLLGNPVVTWGGLAAMTLCLRRLWKRVSFPEVMVFLLFAANYLQWAVTPEKGLFYYYYYPSVIMLGVSIAVALRSLPGRIFGLRISLLVLLAAAVVFVRCYPQMAHLEAPWDCALGCWP